MPAEWRIDHWPTCTSHAFLSHCAEDRERLIVPVFDRLSDRGLTPWVDKHHWPIAADAFEAVREGLLQCRHVVYFVTPALLRQGRGWAQVERGLAEVIQRRLTYGANQMSRFELPLVFAAENDAMLRRSVWRPLHDKFQRCPYPRRARWTRRHIHWAATVIENFIRQEELLGVEVRQRLDQDPFLVREFLRGDNNLRKRVCALAPATLAPPQ